MARKTAEFDIAVGTSSLRYAELAGYILQAFKRANKPRNEEKPEPNESGRPCWVTPDELWFQWAKVWEEIGRAHDVGPGERNKVRARLLSAMATKDFNHQRHRFAGVGRLEYVVFTREWLSALEVLAAGAEEVDGVYGDGDTQKQKNENHEPSTVHAAEVVEI